MLLEIHTPFEGVTIIRIWGSLTVEYITKLVAYARGISDNGISIVMRVPEDPEVYSALSDIVFKFDGERTIGQTVCKLRTLHSERRYMMRNNNFSLGGTLCGCILDEIQTIFMLMVEFCKGEQFSVVENPVKVTNDLFGVMCFPKRYL